MCFGIKLRVPVPNPCRITLSGMLRYPGNTLTAIDEDEMLGEIVQPLRKATKTRFPGL